MRKDQELKPTNFLEVLLGIRLCKNCFPFITLDPHFCRHFVYYYKFETEKLRMWQEGGSNGVEMAMHQMLFAGPHGPPDIHRRHRHDSPAGWCWGRAHRGRGWGGSLHSSTATTQAQELMGTNHWRKSVPFQTLWKWHILLGETQALKRQSQSSWGPSLELRAGVGSQQWGGVKAPQGSMLLPFRENTWRRLLSPPPMDS